MSNKLPVCLNSNSLFINLSILNVCSSQTNCQKTRGSYIATNVFTDTNEDSVVDL